MKQFANNMRETEKLQLQKTSQCQNLLVPHPVPTLEELLKLRQKGRSFGLLNKRISRRDDYGLL